jgi:hypothetical protein
MTKFRQIGLNKKYNFKQRLTLKDAILLIDGISF